MTQLSVNVNKIATLRNARGAHRPNVVQVAVDCEQFGAQGITVHPRPDERHITKKDVYELRDALTTSFNIEGYPDERFMKMIEEVKPAQATLVPDPPNVLTSNAGWNTMKHAPMLTERISAIKSWGVSVSIFIEPDEKMVNGARRCGADQVELYTGHYASHFHLDKEKAIQPYKKAATYARELGLEIHAGHDLNLSNVYYLKKIIPYLKEVSIGHALVCDALYYGLENTIQLYLRNLSYEEC